VNKNVLYTAKYPVTYWQTEGENLPIYTFYSNTVQYSHVHKDLKKKRQKTVTNTLLAKTKVLEWQKQQMF